MLNSENMTSFEHRIRTLTKPRRGTYPRPWTTDTDPESADVLIVGASSAKTFHVADIGDHDQFIDALWNRNGRTCRAMYDAATAKPSRTRPNLDRLSEMLAAHGLTSLQTNVSCASARYDAELSEEDRSHGTEIFKVVVEDVPWRAMIIYGVGASERFGRAFDVSMPSVPSPDAPPVCTKVWGRDVFVSPTLAPRWYRTSVWQYLERVVSVLADNAPPAKPVIPASMSRPEPGQEKTKEILSPSTPPLPQDTPQPDLPEGFCNSAANQLVWRRMHAIAAVTGLTVKPSTQQAALTGGPEFSRTTRVFRHKFKTAKPDILLRRDVFECDSALENAAEWEKHRGKDTFRSVQTNNVQLLDRILDAVESFAKERLP